MKNNETINEEYWKLLQAIEKKGLDTNKFQQILFDLSSYGNTMLLEQLVEILYFCLKK
ncbi:hypothetical protein KUV80_13015 [Fictibacillus nanhaiensis]|uniref:hypothetical protein n=1 Tax=Fictibacillus nanhaiensis TaxID=742169 RepID=UPI001C978347|nr:hypothetical protein [Fictibacillus nanhaiensis]MBY6037584.1 hypothetical protein [Fictibacillus nanhaiensis]